MVPSVCANFAPCESLSPNTPKPEQHHNSSPKLWKLGGEGSKFPQFQRRTHRFGFGLTGGCSGFRKAKLEASKAAAVPSSMPEPSVKRLNADAECPPQSRPV